MNQIIASDEMFDEREQLALEAVEEEEKKVIEEFLLYLDQQGYNFYILKGIRSLLKQEIKKVARCPKCGEEVRSDDDAMCGNCAR